MLGLSVLVYCWVGTFWMGVKQRAREGRPRSGVVCVRAATLSRRSKECERLQPTGQTPFLLPLNKVMGSFRMWRNFKCHLVSNTIRFLQYLSPLYCWPKPAFSNLGIDSWGQIIPCCGAVLCILQYSPASSRYSLDVSSNLPSLPGNQKYFGKYIDKCPLMSKITSIENHWGT